MYLCKVTAIILFAIIVRAEKKIELQDIEEDNLRSELKSEGQKDHDKSDSPQNKGSTSSTDLNSLEFMKSGFLRLFENPQSHSVPQQQRYIHQYAVTEQPEKYAPAPSKFAVQGHQQAMVGYLSNMPMQIYIVPQYYTDQPPQTEPPQEDYQTNSVSSTSTNYPTYSSESTYTQTTGKPFDPYATPPTVTYVYQTQPTAPPAIATVAPLVAYHAPRFHFDSRLVTPTTAPKAFYANPEYSDSNTLADMGEQEPKQFSTQTEIPYLPTVAELPRHYNSRAPLRKPFRHHHNTISDLPRPNPLLLRAQPPHLAHIPRTLPVFRPVTKSVYQEIEPITNPYIARPHGQGYSHNQGYSHSQGPSHNQGLSHGQSFSHGQSLSHDQGLSHGQDHLYEQGPPHGQGFPHGQVVPLHPHHKQRPGSLLDSYIPSSVQVEYLKRGLAKDPSSLFDALSSGKFANPIPRHFERGFLPNQIYPTGNGGVAYGHYKRRNTKPEKNPHQ